MTQPALALGYRRDLQEGAKGTGTEVEAMALFSVLG